MNKNSAILLNACLSQLKIYSGNYLRQNPHLALASCLFASGAMLLPTKFVMVAGALFGAGASLLGAWITEFNTKRSKADERLKQESDAKKYLIPELNRTIERVLFIHSRAVVNYGCASDSYFIAPSESQKNLYTPLDIKEDFLPYLPVLYPNVEQFRHLSGENAIALVAFYDSLYELDTFVKDWWARDSQLAVNLFNQMRTKAAMSLRLACICIDKFEVQENLVQNPDEISVPPLLKRINISLDNDAKTLKFHIERNNKLAQLRGRQSK